MILDCTARYTLDRLRGLQSLVQQEGGGAVQRVMQQYTRLVLLTVEALGLPCDRQLAETSIQAPLGYTLAFQDGENLYHLQSLYTASCPQRACEAAKLIIRMGSTSGVTSTLIHTGVMMLTCRTDRMRSTVT